MPTHSPDPDRQRGPASDAPSERLGLDLYPLSQGSQDLNFPLLCPSKSGREGVQVLAPGLGVSWTLVHKTKPTSGPSMAGLEKMPSRDHLTDRSFIIK